MLINHFSFYNIYIYNIIIIYISCNKYEKKILFKETKKN